MTSMIFGAACTLSANESTKNARARFVISLNYHAPDEAPPLHPLPRRRRARAGAGRALAHGDDEAFPGPLSGAVRGLEPPRGLTPRVDPRRGRGRGRLRA